MNKPERIKMVKAMEYIVRNLNDEQLIMRWLALGVPDGDIRYGDLSVTPQDEDVLDLYLDGDEDFADLMDTFVMLVHDASQKGALYCDNVVSRCPYEN